jgi:cellulose synthase (UDP-forming)
VLYISRDKAPGVPHHAKAGNINSCLLEEGPGLGTFMVVLDCDMIVHPDYLLRTLGHFYTQDHSSAHGWRLKPKAAFLQTPQDFWNVAAVDPMVHCARFFYGPMLQGRDGIGACPCVGTGAVFRRDLLVSIGGQAYGSVTED